VTIPESEALALLRAVFKSAPTATRRVLRANDVPLRAESVPGWSYYVQSDRVVYDGSIVGGN
jgi:hypothetical protein